MASQWIILLGLEPIFAYKKYRDNPKGLYGVAALLGLFSGTIHLYYLVMCGIILAGICLLDIISRRKIIRSFFMLLIYLFTACASIGLLGGFSSGISTGGSGLGSYSANINALFNPQGKSVIFQNLPLYVDKQYVGFAWLGAGVLFMLVLSAVFLLNSNKSTEYLENRRPQIISLAVVSVLAFLFALSPVVTLGSKELFTLKLPGFVTDLWSIFRATGRIIWVVVYVIMLCCVIIPAKELKRQALIIVISAALLLQIYDMHIVLKNKYENFSQIKTYESPLSITDFWDKLADNNQVKHIVYFSSIDNTLRYPITDWALDNDITLNNFYFARSVSAFVSEGRAQALAALSDDTVFIFNPDDILYCKNYNLNYYRIDGLIIGYVNEIEGFQALSESEFFLSWNFGENEYLSESDGEDTEKGRILYPGGQSCGPYWTVTGGTYIITITGEGLSDVSIVLQSQSGDLYHDFEITESSDSEISLSLSLTSKATDFEVCITNNSQDNILLNEIIIVRTK